MTTALIGRERELEELVDRLEDSRLVTIVGPGGIGKTTVARALADRHAAAFPLGAHFVDLTTVDDGEAVGGALAARLGFPSFRALLDSPSDQPALLVVDNCEHVLDAAAEAVDALLGSCQSPVVLATSRSPLDLPGESLLVLGPLAVPTHGVGESDAVRFFLDRSRHAGANVPEDQAEVVAALCRALDGVPLALEIAAARTLVLTPAEILARLDEQGDLDTLARPRFRGSERHRTVRSTIEWSYVQLDEDSSRRLDRLGVLAGAFTSGVAQAVADDGDEAETLDGLETLVRASLLVAETDGEVTRYRFLRTVRLFALERLADRGETHETWVRFVEHSILAVNELTPSGRQAWRPGALLGLLTLTEDLLAALRWCVANESTPGRSFALLGGLWSIIHQSHMEDVAALGEAALARWPEAGDPGRADAMATVATCRHLLGRPDEAIELAEAAQAGTVTSALAACALPRVIGRARASLGDAAGALEAFIEAERTAAEIGLAPFTREAVTLQAISLADLERVDEAQALLAGVEAEAAGAGDQMNELWARVASGFLRLKDDPDEAERTFDGVLGPARAIGYGTGVLTALQGLALARLATGDPPATHATIVDLLDEMTTGGAVSEPRSAIRAAAVALHRAGDGLWADLAATADQLPVISAFAAVGPEMFPLPPGDGRALATNEAITRARRALAAGPAPTRAEAPPDADRTQHSEGRFERSGDAWLIDWAGRSLTMRSSKGMQDLGRLLAEPGREVHCLELAGAGTEQGSTGEVIDETARREYEQRIRDLQAEIDEAEDHNDHARADRAQAEFDAVVEHLAGALGLGGRARRGGSTAERARSAVTHRIRATIRRLSDEHPELGRHLSVSVTTGVFCRYQPERPVHWTT